MNYFHYTDKEIEYLSKKDEELGEAIERIGMIKREVNPDIFCCLVKMMVGQLVSNKVHKVLWGRFLDKLGEVTPTTISNCSTLEIEMFGLSKKKAINIKRIADEVLSGSLDLDKITLLSDELAIKELVKLEGVGVWTAEMLLLFSLQRPNIFSFKDLALHRGLRELYGHAEITPQIFERYRKRFTPYCSVASLYLWEIASGSK